MIYENILGYLQITQWRDAIRRVILLVSRDSYIDYRWWHCRAEFLNATDAYIIFKIIWEQWKGVERENQTQVAVIYWKQIIAAKSLLWWRTVLNSRMITEKSKLWFRSIRNFRNWTQPEKINLVGTLVLSIIKCGFETKISIRPAHPQTD